jgi:hypothetical protein
MSRDHITPSSCFCELSVSVYQKDDGVDEEASIDAKEGSSSKVPPDIDRCL